jgi:hypothetical protein
MEVNVQLYAPAAVLLGKVLDTHEAECTLLLMWMILERRKSLASARNQTLSRLASSLLGAQTTVSWLFMDTRIDHCQCNSILGFFI